MKHSSYFEGKVQSLGMNTEKGYATVGVIEPGKYNFSTSQEETMVITEGSMKVKLPGKEWKFFKKGDKFTVAPKQAFDIDAEKEAAYICYYK